MSEQTNQAAIEALIRAINANDREAMAELFGRCDHGFSPIRSASGARATGERFTTVSFASEGKRANSAGG
jgi:hypothetical protein